MGRIIFRFLSIAVFCLGIFCFISCGVTTGEVVEAGAVPEIGNIKIISVQPEEIPIIEICPPPFELAFSDDMIAEREQGEPGDSYDNLFPPYAENYSDIGMVIVYTDVPGVKISLNNRDIGFSDIGIVGVTPRIYILGLSKEGYKDKNLWISVGENKKQFFSVKMEKKGE